MAQKTQYEVINLGNNETISLSQMVKAIEDEVGRKAILDKLPMQPGDVPRTWANVSKAKELLNYSPSTNFSDGISLFKDWYLQANQIVSQTELGNLIEAIHVCLQGKIKLMTFSPSKAHKHTY